MLFVLVLKVLVGLIRFEFDLCDNLNSVSDVCSGCMWVFMDVMLIFWYLIVCKKYNFLRGVKFKCLNDKLK